MVATAETILDTLATQRPHYKQILNAIDKTQLSKAKTLSSGFKAHPLYPYVLAADLTRRLERVTPTEVEAFLNAYHGSYPAARLRRAWLRKLARAGRSNDFLSAYETQRDPELACFALHAQMKNTGKNKHPIINFRELRRLWFSKRSQHSNCDPAFARLLAQGIIDDRMIWERVLLVLGARQTKLARSLVKRFQSAHWQSLAQTLLDVHARPQRALQHKNMAVDSAETRRIAMHAVKRRLRRDFAAGRTLWKQLKSRFAFTAEEISAVDAHVALTAIRKNVADLGNLFDKLPTSTSDAKLQEAQLRYGLETRAWAGLARWTAAAAAPGMYELRWRYWHARALEESGHRQEASAIFHDLARERDYYGYLAADKLGVPYAMTHRPVTAKLIEQNELIMRPGIQRVHELYRLRRYAQARAELAHELRKLTPRETEVMAELLFSWGWHNRAIATLGRIQSYDDLDIRFPLLFQTQVDRQAADRRVAPAMIYSIIRAESAFNPEAKSAAGALGLMQLMPATGKATAKAIGLRVRQSRELFQVDKNIAIGTAYMERLLRRFDAYFPLAAAAYNAGPKRVNSWLVERGCVAADIWIDTIPFAETRSYVRRTLFYHTIYEWRLGRERHQLNHWISAMIGRNGKTATC